ncbi:hypothetical protein [Methylobacter tundripaludum]|uniref:hypothetical protein n=1 Tax=Methylobacter tundripaludum TaxID=173365 RepID=UPI0001E5100C|nr:hypothetical protein [Methylobacter tundripaludum]
MTTHNFNDYPLPEWAEKLSDGAYMEIGAQLATRDGRRCGNAYVDEIASHKTLGEVATVITDMGNRITMTESEMESAFYPPTYVMKIIEARRWRNAELLTAARLALPLMESFFRDHEGKGTIKRLKQAINNLEEKI